MQSYTLESALFEPIECIALIETYEHLFAEKTVFYKTILMRKFKSLSEKRISKRKKRKEYEET